MLHTLKNISNNFLRKRLVPLILSFLVLSSSLFPAYAQEVLIHEETESFPVTRGVTYEGKTLFTSGGWQKIHVLKVDLSSTNVDVDTLIGKEGLAKRDSLSKMVLDNNAIAGINGDFFIMATPSAPVGVQVQSGRLVSSPSNRKDMAAFGLTLDNLPQILLMEFKGDIIAPNGSRAEIGGINKIGDTYNKAFVFTPEYGKTTPKVSESSPDLTFAVTKNRQIVNIFDGKTAEIPTDGLVLMARGEAANFIKNNFTIGDAIDLDLNITPDISNIKMALGGGAILVENGTIPPKFSHNIAGTNPRTAVGFTADKKTMILAVVDGRQTISRGMTLREMAELMIKLGAFNALNLDGGGSTTMVVRPLAEKQPKVINSLSGGVQRLIANGIGIFSKAPTGNVSGFKVVASSFNVPKGGHRTFEVKAYDENFNPIDIDQNSINWSVTGNLGSFSGNTLKANQSGYGQVIATLGDIKASQEIHVLDDGVSLSVEPTNVRVNPGSSTIFNVYIKDKKGFKAPVDPRDISWEITGNIGTVDANRFTANVGSGTVIANFSGLRAGALVQTGLNQMLLDDFESLEGKSFSSYPETVGANFELTSDLDPVHGGNSSGKLSYDFTVGDSTKAAYVNFDSDQGLSLPIDTEKIGLWVYGDAKEHWLRAQVVDATGKETTIDLARNINWLDWKWVEASLPAGKQPFSLKSIYLVETDPEKSDEGTIYLDNLTALISSKLDESQLPPKPILIDEANTGKKGSGFAFGVVGTLPMSKDFRADHLKTLNLAASVINKQNPSLNLVVGRPWADNSVLKNQLMAFKNYKTTGEYSTFSQGGASFFLLDVSKGGIRSTNFHQWIKLKLDLEAAKNAKNIFFVLNRTLDSFTDPYEVELFKKILSDHAKKYGTKVWVLGGEASKFYSQKQDGVNYLSIPGIYSSEPAAAVFNVSKDQVSYQVIPLVEKITAESTTVKSGIASNIKVYGISPTNQKVLLGYPYSVDWKFSSGNPVGFDSRTLTFKTVGEGAVKVDVKTANTSSSFNISVCNMSVVVNGREVIFPDQPPYINKNQRTMVPVRFISESLGAKVNWNGKTKTVVIEKDGTTINLTIGQNKATVNGKIVTFDTSAEMKNGRTMVPLRFVSEVMGAKIDWDENTKTVNISD